MKPIQTIEQVAADAIAAINQAKAKAIEAYKLNCRNYTACCFDEKPCTADCEYLSDFTQKLNEK